MSLHYPHSPAVYVPVNIRRATETVSDETPTYTPLRHPAKTAHSAAQQDETHTPQQIYRSSPGSPSKQNTKKPHDNPQLHRPYAIRPAYSDHNQDQRTQKVPASAPADRHW